MNISTKIRTFSGDSGISLPLFGIEIDVIRQKAWTVCLMLPFMAHFPKAWASDHYPGGVDGKESDRFDWGRNGGPRELHFAPDQALGRNSPTGHWEASFERLNFPKISLPRVTSQDQNGQALVNLDYNPWCLFSDQYRKMSNSDP